MKIVRVENGNTLSPAGFQAGSAYCGIQTTSTEGDVALLLSDGPAAAAGLFTTNRFAAAPVQWCREILPASGTRAIVANAGNANACTGEQGRQDVRASAQLVAELVGCAAADVCVASTGIIGHPLPMDKLTQGIRAAHASLAADGAAGQAAARAIMTTDTRPKTCAVRVETPGGTFGVGGMTKGAAMIAPNMATTLCFVTTDAAVPVAVLQEAMRRAVDLSYNRITIDGDCSTNDTALCLAGGASGVAVPADGPLRDAFDEALQEVMKDLAVQIVADAEGGTKVVEVRVTGARTPHEAGRVARAIAESQLFQCAVAGADPNWGRIVCAAGYSGVNVDPASTSVTIGTDRVLDKGTPTGVDATATMQGDRITVQVELGQGAAEACLYTSDLTQEYVHLNSDYHT
jgi:glutamate N-acetyltransferase/amino-acid N-acetyltransferase